jgi:hypothetical protein
MEGLVDKECLIALNATALPFLSTSGQESSLNEVQPVWSFMDVPRCEESMVFGATYVVVK